MADNEARPLAVVTGASSGIGLELAKVIGEHGYDLIINAEDDELIGAEAVLTAQGAKVESVRADLARPEGVERLHERIGQDGRPVSILALNAGIGEGGDFVRESDLDKDLRIVDLNVRSVVHLAKLELEPMVARNEGRVLITSSIASTMPGANQSVYNASKSFVQSFALALRSELRDTDVTITSLMPGPTETEFFERAGMQDTKVGAGDKDDPAEVARQGFNALINGRDRVVAGSIKNRVQAVAGRFIPDAAKAEMHKRMAQLGAGGR